MFKQFASVGGLTLISRLSGFARDVVMADVLGAGRLADAFLVALRIPNNFRQIFAEGAFNAAYVPAYTRLQVQKGPEAARQFFAQLYSLLLASQLILLAIAWAFMPQIISLIAPGYRSDPGKFALAATMTRITFPYLTCIVLVTLHSATLNANRKFAAAASVSILLNLCIIAFLALGFLFPNAGIAASVGVLVAGFVQLAFIILAARRAGLSESLAMPRWNADLKHFFKVLGPAVIGSAGLQIAIFVDTILASTLGNGAQSSINYADRLYLLPIGVIGVAAGTVLLPEMSRRHSQGNTKGAHAAQNTTLTVTWALTAPFFIAFLTIPDLLLNAAYVRGKFTIADAIAAGQVLWAYGLGIMAVVSVRSAVASFQAVGDLRTPMYASLIAIAANVALKLVLIKPFGVAGLALATAAGAWINLYLLIYLARRRGLMRFDDALVKTLACTINSALWLAVIVRGAYEPIAKLASHFGHFAAITQVLLLALAGGLVYSGLMFSQLRLLSIEVPILDRFMRRRAR